MSYEKESDDLDDLDGQNAEPLPESLANEPPQERVKSFANAAALLSFLQTLPVQKLIEDARLSSCLRRSRIDGGIRLDDLASALNQRTELIEQFESKDSLPWTLPATAMTDLAIAFRLHLTVIETLIEKSFFFARLEGRVANKEEAALLISAWLANVRSDLEERNAIELLN